MRREPGICRMRLKQKLGKTEKDFKVAGFYLRQNKTKKYCGRELIRSFWFSL